MKVFSSLVVMALMLMAIPQMSTAQSCRNYHKKNCEGADSDLFNYNSQSKSGLFAPGFTSDLHLVAYSGRDYRISLCQDNEEAENLKFKVLDARSQEILFDNAMDEDSQYFEFTCRSTQKLILRLSVPGETESGKKGSTKSKNANLEEMFCIGVLIEDMDTPDSGF